MTPLLAESCRGWLWSDSVGVSEVKGSRNPRLRSWASLLPGPCREVWAASWRRRHVLAECCVVTEPAGPGEELRRALGKDTLAFPTWKGIEAQA